MTLPRRRCCRPSARAALALTALIILTACITNVEYARPGEPLRARENEALVFGRFRFVENGREYFPWRVSFMDYERHLWLLRLADRHGTWELHPEGNGTLAIWLRPGDYALVGSESPLGSASRDQGIVAFLRVPAGAAVVNAGEVTFSIEHPEGGWFRGLFGTAVVRPAAPTPVLRTFMGADGEPATPVESLWCVDERVADLRGEAFETAYRALLDSGCAPQR